MSLWTFLDPLPNNDISYHVLNNYCVGGEAGVCLLVRRSLLKHLLL